MMIKIQTHLIYPYKTPKDCVQIKFDFFDSIIYLNNKEQICLYVQYSTLNFIKIRTPVIEIKNNLAFYLKFDNNNLKTKYISKT
jgi:hypothetical protein